MSLAATDLRQFLEWQHSRQPGLIVNTVMALTERELSALVRTCVGVLAYPEKHPDFRLQRGIYELEVLKELEELAAALRARRSTEVDGGGAFRLELDFAPGILQELVIAARSTGRQDEVRRPAPEAWAVVLVAIGVIANPASSPSLGLVRVRE